MKYPASLLACLGGKSSPSAKNVTDILGSVGVEVDAERLNFFLGEVKGKDIIELIVAGRKKLASVPSGGGVAVVTAPAAGGFSLFD